MDEQKTGRKRGVSRKHRLSVVGRAILLGIALLVVGAVGLLAVYLQSGRSPAPRRRAPAPSGEPREVARSPKPAKAAVESQKGAGDKEQIRDGAAGDREPQAEFAELLERGILALEEGKSAQAVSLLRRACALNPESAEGWLAVVAALRVARDFGQAWQSCERALASVPGDLTGLRREFSHLARDCGRPAVALAQAELILAAHPEDGDAHLVAAQALLNLGRSHAALEHASQAVRSAPGEPAAQVALGRALAEEGRASEAVIVLRRVLAEYPGSPHASLALARALRLLGDEEGARAALAAVDSQLANGGQLIEVVLPEDANLPPGVFNSEKAVAAMAAAERAELLLRDGKGAEAIAEYQRLADANPDLHSIHYRLAELMLLSGRPEAARKLAEQRLARDAGEAGAHTILASVYLSSNLLGLAGAECAKALAGPAGSPAVIDARKVLAVVHNRSGRPKEAATEMQAYLSLRPNDGDAILRLAAFQQASGDLPGALQTLRDGAQRFPKEPAFAAQEAMALRQSGDRGGAIAAVRKTIELGGDGATNFLMLATMLLEERDIAGATASARVAREKAPASHLVADTLGWCLVQGGQLEEALPHLQFALSVFPDAPRYRFHHAVLLRRQSRVPEALAELRAALASPRQYPERQEAEALLAELTGGAK